MKPIITLISLLILTFSTAFSSGQNDPRIMSTSISSYPTLKLTEIVGNSSVKGDKQQKSKVSRQEYIKHNLQKIKIDIATGEGENLDTLASFYKIKGIVNSR